MSPRLIPILALSALCLPLSPPASAQEASPDRLVRDLNRQPGDFTAHIEWLLPVGPDGDRAVFRMATQAAGAELWTSDGTPRGTRLLKEFIPGSLGGYPDSPVSGGGKVMVQATGADFRPQLWITDGTPAGTRLAAELPAGREGYLRPLAGTAAGGFYYRMDLTDGDRGDWLWFTDGTPQGTRPVAPQDGSGQLLLGEAYEFAAAPAGQGNGHLIYFTGQDGGVWRCEGTRESTRKIVDVPAIWDDAFPIGFGTSGGRVYMQVSKQSAGEQLWSCTPEGAELATLLPGGEDIWFLSSSVKPAGTGDAAYFSALDGLYLPHLFLTDGTAAGTREIPLIHTDGATYGPIQNIYPSAIWRGSYYFAAQAFGGGRGLWVTDGTPAGTRMLKETSTFNDDVGPLEITAAGDFVYFQIVAEAGGSELWRTDGTVVGTRRVSRMPDDNAAYSNGRQSVALQGDLAFVSGRPGTDYALWRTRAQKGVVRLTKPEKSTGSGFLWSAGLDLPLSYEEVDGALLSFARQGYGIGVSELWRIAPAQGRAAGGLAAKLGRTAGAKLKPLWTAPPYGPQDAAFVLDGAGFRGKVNGRGIFTMRILFRGREELWATDGSRRGTRLLKDHSEEVFGVGLGPALSDFVNSGGKLFYAVRSSLPAASGLWRTDGTPEGTVKVPLPEGLTLSHDWGKQIANFKGELYFAAKAGNAGYGLWKTDGTTAGTVLVKDGWNGGKDEEPMNLVVTGGRLSFGVHFPLTHVETLWTTDGTTAGTLIVQPPVLTETTVHHVGPGFDLGGLHVFAGRGLGANVATQWWRSDGTAAGTYPLLQGLTIDHLPYNASGPEVLGALAGGKIFYAGHEPIGVNDAMELWVTDGTTQGTRKVKEIYPGTPSSSPSEFLAVGNVVYFAANHPEHGVELWRSDGTAAGTVLAADIEPGAESSFPEDLKVINGKLYFHAQRPAIGRELFSIDLE